MRKLTDGETEKLSRFEFNGKTEMSSGIESNSVVGEEQPGSENGDDETG